MGTPPLSAVFLFLVLGVVLPILINKTTEHGRFDFIHPYLREIWTALLMLCTYFYFLNQPSTREWVTAMHRKFSISSPVTSYIVIFVLGGVLLTLYWRVTGLVVKGSSSPPNEHQPTAAEIADELAKRLGHPGSPNGEHTEHTGPLGERTLPPRGPELKLIFKDSSLFTPSRKQRIAGEMEKFYRYLVELGLEAPKEVPPLGVREQGAFGMAGTFPGPVYLDSVGLPSSALDDPMTPVRGYAMYCFPFMLRVSSRPFGADRRQRASWIFQSYFVSSFNGKRPQTGTSDIAKWIDGLWDIRQRYGQDFADRLVPFGLKSLSDFGDEGGNEKLDFTTYFYNSVMLGESVVDNDFSKMPKINQILELRGLVPNAKH